MKRRIILVLACLLLVIGSNVPLAHSQAANVRLIVEEVDNDGTPDVNDADFPTLSLEVTPINESGVPIGSLKKGDFTLLEDGTPVEEFDFMPIQDSNEGISIMLVLDISGSMRDQLDELRAAAITLYDYLEPSDQSAMIAFNETADGTAVDLSDPFPNLNLEREMAFTNDEGALINLVNGLQIEERAGTPLYDALFKGVRMTALETDFGRRAVILMTDGKDIDRNGATPGSRIADANTAINEAQRQSIPIFTIGLGQDIDSAILQRAATLTGGTYQNTPDAERLGQLFTGIAEQLKQKYRLSYESKIVPDGNQHNLTIRVETRLGTAAETTSFKANYPVIPWVRNVSAALPRQDARLLQDLSSVKGRVTIEPDIRAQGAIAEVNYFVDGNLAHTAMGTPWTFVWDTTNLAPNENHELRIEASDDGNPANVGEVTMAVLVEECSVICQLEQTFPVPPNYLLIGVGALLILLVIVLMARRRDVSPHPVTVYTPAVPTQPDMKLSFPVADFMPPVVAPPPANPTTPLYAAPPNPGNGPGIVLGRPSPKTEVLRKEPDVVAFLIDPKNGREFRLLAETSIGREASSDVILDDGSVSNRHAKVKLEGKQFMLYDLASTNPTKVNGEEITRHLLRDGDKVEIGRQTLVFKQISA